ncbi:MAG: hypothetical protein R3B82_29685 [Sandaracinaceae bacterium]
MTVYWTLAETGSPPEKGTPPNVRDRPLQPDDCLVYRTKEELIRSDAMDEAVADEEDLARQREVLTLHAVPESEAAPFSGPGVYVKVHTIASREPLLPWLEGLASGGGDEAEAAGEVLETYRLMREAFESEG